LAAVKIYLDDELDQRFRRLAMNVYGYGRGSISKAASDALADWCRGHDVARETSSQGPDVTPEAINNIAKQEGHKPSALHQGF